MSKPNEAPQIVTRDLLREWGLPDAGDSKKSRGDVLVVGGSLRTPGAVILALEATLRVGAGRAAAIVPGTIDAHLGAAVPEAAIHTLPEHAGEPFDDAVAGRIPSADAVLVGPGFDDPEETRLTIRDVAAQHPQVLVLDAYGLGVLPRFDRATLPDGLVLTPNREELALLLDRDLGEDLTADVREVATKYRATVTCYGSIVSPEGDAWLVEEGGAGLATAGSGDALAGAIAGMCARGLDPARATVWGTWVHARAGDRLTERAGLTFLARELVVELSAAELEITGASEDAGPTADEPVGGWLDRLAHTSGDVGGGAGCAVLTAMSAAMLAMVAGYGDDAQSQAVAARAAEVRQAAVAAADRDGEQSAGLGAALREDGDVAEAALAAAQASLAIGTLAADLVSGWEHVAGTAKAYLRPDVVVGATTLEAALRGALATVRDDLALARKRGAEADAGTDAALDRLRAARDRARTLAPEE
ncbi:MAG: nnrD [Microbacterium sp.]|jgi:hydroxyethylthiazole kinase-like uncharacterized protein yjeF|nr:nnrD [Microbacterium sp.]